MRQSIEERKVASLARQYQERGYTVLANLKGYGRPEAIGGFAPDLIVQRGDEKIVIEVVSSMSMKGQQHAIIELARHAATEKGMRFDLVVTNPRPTKNERARRADRQLRRLESSLLSNLDLSAENRQLVSFFILAGVVVEHLVLGLWDEHVGEPTSGSDPVKLASLLLDRKVISSSAFNFINELWRLRNEAVHGSPEPRGPGQLRELSSKVKNLAASYAKVTDERP